MEARRETRAGEHTQNSQTPLLARRSLRGRTFKTRKLPAHDVPHGRGILFGALGGATSGGGTAVKLLSQINRPNDRWHPSRMLDPDQRPDVVSRLMSTVAGRIIFGDSKGEPA